jgi:uncharacterized membrane protein YeaQ/YmgE (transglycosylase-associated protein family)
MNGLDGLLGWAAIGAAASLAALMWPFLRGGTGVLIKLVLGPLGAVGAALTSHVAIPHEPPIERLIFAAIGAIASLVALQVVWQRYARSKTTPLGVGGH